MCDYLRSAPLRRVAQPSKERPFWNLIGSILACSVAFVISLPLLLASLLALPICATVRWILFYFYRHRLHSQLGTNAERMQAHEIRWVGDNSVSHYILIFDSRKGLTLDQFQRLFTTRILPVYPRLTRLPIPMPSSAGGGYSWQQDCQFSVSHHIVLGPENLNDMDDINSYVNLLLQTGLPKDKPPWEFQVIPSFGKQRDTVVVARVHQSIADGTSLFRVLYHSLADSENLEIVERPRFGCFAFGFNIFRACLTGPFTLLVWLCLTSGDCNPLTRHCTWSGSLTVSWSASIALPKVIRIKQVTRSSVNCVVLSALAGALRKLLKGCGVRRPPNVKVLFPLDIRSDAGNTALGNKGASVILPLPVSLEGCIPRLWATRRILRSLSTSSDPVLVYIATAILMAVTPTSVAKYLLDLIANKTSLQFCCFPGPSSHFTVEGETLKQMFCMVPAPSNVGISVTAITYADQVHVSVAAERALGPTAQLLLDYLENQVQVLWTLLLHRRVPGEGRTILPVIPENINSSVQEIERRMLLVHRELMELPSGSRARKGGKVALLKSEFSQLLAELKRRLSSGEIEMYEDIMTKAGERALSCSMSSRPSATSLNNMQPRKSNSNIVCVKTEDNIDSVDNQQDGVIDRIQSAQKNTGTVKSEETEKNLETSCSISIPSTSLSDQKHRKNSFEIIRDMNKRRNLQQSIQITLSQVSEKESECGGLKHCPDTERLSEADVDKIKDSGSELDTETDYSDTTIKFSDDETMDLDYDDLKKSGPINKNLRDLYCSNYLDHKLSLLKGEERRLSEQMDGVNYEFYRAIDDNDVEGGLLI